MIIGVALALPNPQGAGFDFQGQIGRIKDKTPKQAPAPFLLKSVINGKSISSCHFGAAIGDSTNDAYQTYLNTTEGSTSPVKGYGPGEKSLCSTDPMATNWLAICRWGIVESEAMQFFYEPCTNVAHPLFELILNMKPYIKSNANYSLESHY
ncbi:hypothetical protein MY3296_004647 [Beauveria thailandica]